MLLLTSKGTDLEILCSTTDDTTDNEDEMPTDPNIRAIRGERNTGDADVWVNAHLDLVFEAGTTIDLD